MRLRHSLNKSNYRNQSNELEKPISHEKVYLKKKEKNLDNLTDKIKEIFNSTYEENFSEILIKRKDIFLNEIINESEKMIYNFFPKEKKEKIKEKIDLSKENLEIKYNSNYTFLKSEWKNFQKNSDKYNFLVKFRKHCIKTEKYAYHNCINEKSKLIEIKENNKSEKINYLICIECKKVYLAKEILLYCTYCNLEYYSCVLSKDENINLLPSTWEKYHCGNLINNTMKCIKCQNILYLDLIENYLVCLNKKCNFKAKPESIIWNCLICKKDFISKAKIYNPLEMEIIKRSINKALLFKEKCFPTEIPCCKKYNIKELNFFHKEDCNGILYKGKLSNKTIIVCNKCHAMNFYDKFIWTCPICNKKFRNYKSVWGNFFKKKEYLIPQLNSSNVSRRNFEDNNINNINYFYNKFGRSVEDKKYQIKKNLTELNSFNESNNRKTISNLNSSKGEKNKNINLLTEYPVNQSVKKKILIELCI